MLLNILQVNSFIDVWLFHSCESISCLKILISRGRIAALRLNMVMVIFMCALRGDCQSRQIHRCRASHRCRSAHPPTPRRLVHPARGCCRLRSAGVSVKAWVVHWLMLEFSRRIVMIDDLDFLDHCASSATIVGAGATASTAVGIAVGPGYAAAGAAAGATGRTGTYTDAGAITLATPGSGRATAWATAVGQDGSSTAYSSDRASGYANGGTYLTRTSSATR
jgi:hypothetical protein